MRRSIKVKDCKNYFRKQVITLYGCPNIALINPIEKMWAQVKSVRKKFRVKDIDILFKDYCDDLFRI